MDIWMWSAGTGTIGTLAVVVAALAGGCSSTGTPKAETATSGVENRVEIGSGTLQGQPRGSDAQTTMTTSVPNLVPADSQSPTAGVCGLAQGKVVTVQLNPDTPSPRCSKVTADQQLRVVNATNGFGQPGREVTVTFASFPPRHLAIGSETTYSPEFGTYLAPGVHDLRISPSYAAEIWLGNW